MRSTYLHWLHVRTIFSCKCRAKDGIKFLEDTENQWKPRNSLVTHVWWHKALFNVQLGKFEQALTLWDDVIIPNVKKCKEYVENGICILQQ